MSEHEPLVLDHHAWNQQELLQYVLERHFVLGEEVAAGIAWQAQARGNTSDSDALVEMNSHLEELGWLAMLDEGKPNILSIAPYPISEPMIPNWQNFAVWSMMAGFLTLVGSTWQLRFNPDSASFDQDILLNSITQFSLPIMFVLFLASDIRKRTAAHFGIEIGHIVPIAFPIVSPIWPFGIAGLLSQRRADLTPIPDRKSLGMIEFVAPLTLFLSGTILTLIGLSFTSSEPPVLNEVPIAFQNNPLISILSLDWIGEDLTIRLQWPHLSALAGIGLSLVGWTLLLPIPGLPGDRLLYSIIGPREMSNPEQQTPVFIATLAAVVLIFVNTEYWPWLLIGAIAAMRRFSPENTPSPLVVDVAKGISDDDRLKFSAILVFILLLGFPGMNPTFEVPDWDGGLSTDDWEELVFFEDGQVEFELILEPSGIALVSGWLQMRVEGDPLGNWQIESECLDERAVCRFDDVSQASHEEVSFNLSRTVDASPQAFRLVILIDVDGHVDEHSIVFQPTGVTTSIDPLWVIVEDTETPRICVEMLVIEGDYVNLTNSNQFWSFENETSLEEGLHDLCMRGHEGAMFSQERSPDSYFSMGPEITISRSNGSNDILVMPIEESQIRLAFSDGEWQFLSSNRPYEFSITRGESGSAFCPSTNVIAGVNSTGEWEIELSDQSSIIIPENSLGVGTLKMNGPGWLAICDDTNMLSWYSMVEGPDVLPNYGEEFIISNRENYSMSISLDWTGDAAGSDFWDVSVPSEVSAMSSVQVNITSNGDPEASLVYWVTTGDDEITLNLAARSFIEV
ncbi:MAG: hypothetical protein P8Q35_00270 [Candidatus Thalassarchaeaceae archaeon]|nr:hypothetical protein [Candidatus Thalassarchaeaceae archaeon]